MDSLRATPREVEYYHIPNQFIPWLFNPLQGCGRNYYPIPWVATHGYSHLTTLWLWVVGIMAVHHFPCIAYMVIYIQPRCGYELLEYWVGGYSMGCNPWLFTFNHVVVMSGWNNGCPSFPMHCIHGYSYSTTLWLKIVAI